MSSATRLATYADLEAVPPHLVAELIDGALVTHPRPAPKHVVASSSLGATIGFEFGRVHSIPGGWVILDKPELHLGSDVVVPDIAGWRKERFAGLLETAYFTTPPDWVCEVVSPSTEACDRGPKRRIYAQAGVSFFWLLDPRVEILETFTLDEAGWVLTGTFGCEDAVSAAPFDAISLPLADLWPFGTTSTGEAERPQDDTP